MAGYVQTVRELQEKIHALTMERDMLRSELFASVPTTNGKPYLPQLAVDNPLFVGFCRYLVQEGMFTAKQLLGVIDRPDRWTTEFDEWKEHGSAKSIE